MKLPIVSTTGPMLPDDIRRALVASSDLAAILRLRRAGWAVETDGVRVRAKRGPGFSAKGKG